LTSIARYKALSDRRGQTEDELTEEIDGRLAASRLTRPSSAPRVR
jgi:hypothetical protein